MKKIFSILICLATIVCLFSSCKSETAKLRVIMMGDVNAATAVKLMEASENGESKLSYTFETVDTAQSIYAKIGGGEADIAIAPGSVATTLYNKVKGDLTVFAIVYKGEISLLENGNTINSLSDLKGKEIFIGGKTNPVKYMFENILKKNGIDPKNDVTITVLENNSAIVDALADGTAKIAVTTQSEKYSAIAKNSSVRSVMGLSSEWSLASDDAGFVAGCVFISKSFVEKNPSAVKKFIKEYKKSVEAVSVDLNSTAKLCVKHGIMESEEVAKSTLKSCKVEFVEGNNMKTYLKKHINALYKVGMTALGAKAPGNSFYYNAD